ncbi:MAG TPA: hypothetical protein VGA24_06740 [Steroidobacteraceae bacterium]
MRSAVTPGRGLRAATKVLVLALGSCATAEVTRRGPGYKLYQVGNPADVVRPTRGPTACRVAATAAARKP